VHAAARSKAWHEHLEEGLLAFLMVAMTLVSFVQVVARYGFNYSFTWALELTTDLFGALIFIGIAYGIRTGAHLGVDIVIARLKAPAARVCAAIAALLCLVYAGIVFVGGWTYVAKMHQIGITMRGIHCWMGTSCISLPTSSIFITYCVLPHTTISE